MFEKGHRIARAVLLVGALALHATSVSNASDDPEGPIIPESRYVVAEGDLLGTIAARIEGRAAGTIQALSARILELNPDAFRDGDPGHILVGSEIQIPSNGPWMSADAGRNWQQAAGASIAPGSTYRVGTGDTLSTIAGRLEGRRPGTIEMISREIFDSNPMAFEDGEISRIRLGALLTMPASGSWQAEPIVKSESEGSLQGLSEVAMEAVIQSAGPAEEIEVESALQDEAVAEVVEAKPTIQLPETEPLEEISTDRFPERLAVPLMLVASNREKAPDRVLEEQPSNRTDEASIAAAAAAAVAATKPTPARTIPVEPEGSGSTGGASTPGAANTPGSAGNAASLLPDEIKAIGAGVGLGLVISAILLQSVLRRPRRRKDRKRMGHEPTLNAFERPEFEEPPEDYLKTVIQKAPSVEDIDTVPAPENHQEPEVEEVPLVAAEHTSAQADDDFGRETVPDVSARLAAEEARRAREADKASEDSGSDPEPAAEVATESGEERHMEPAAEVSAEPIAQETTASQNEGPESELGSGQETVAAAAPEDDIPDDISIGDVAEHGIMPWEDEAIPALLDTQPELEGAEESSEGMVVAETATDADLAAFAAAGFDTPDADSAPEEVAEAESEPDDADTPAADDRIVADADDLADEPGTVMEMLDEISIDEFKDDDPGLSEPPVTIDASEPGDDLLEFDMAEFDPAESAEPAVATVSDTSSQDEDAIDLASLMASSEDGEGTESLADALEMLEQDYEQEFGESQLLDQGEVDEIIGAQSDR